MSAPESLREEVEAVLTEHSYTYPANAGDIGNRELAGRRRCTCGALLPRGVVSDTFATHLADTLLATPALADLIREKQAEAWDEGFTRGFYDVLAGGDRDASESKADNPYHEEPT